MPAGVRVLGAWWVAQPTSRTCTLMPIRLMEHYRASIRYEYTV